MLAERCKLLIAAMTAISGLAHHAIASDHSATLRVIDGDEIMLLDVEALRALGTAQVSTSTPWTTGVQQFVGTPLSLIVPAIDPQANLTMTAINDYAVTMQTSQIGNDYPIVAFERNGAPMSVRDKGPFWMVYPFDASADYQTETIFALSIWQLVEIKVTYGQVEEK